MSTTRLKQKFAPAVSIISLIALIAGFADSAIAAPGHSVTNAVLSVTITPPGYGSVSPNDGGKSLQVGKSFSLTAKPVKGCAFTGWTGDASAATTKLTFTMQPGLSFTANFADVGRPTLVVLSPKAKQSVAGSTITVTGKASDNVGVTGVYYQLNGGDWTLANGLTSWEVTDLPLAPGTNVISAFAVDFAGNASLTNRITFTHPVTFTGIYVGQTDDISGPGGFVLFVDAKQSGLLIGGVPYNNDNGDAVFGSCTVANGQGVSSSDGSNLSFAINTNGQVNLNVTVPLQWQVTGALVSDGPFKSVAGTYSAKVSGETIEGILSPDGWFYASSPGHQGGGRCQFLGFGQATAVQSLGHTVLTLTLNSNATITLVGSNGNGNLSATVKRVDALP